MIMRESHPEAIPVFGCMSRVEAIGNSNPVSLQGLPSLVLSTYLEALLT